MKRLKMLFVIEKFGGGAEKVLKNLVTRLDPSRFEVTVQSIWPFPEGQDFDKGVHFKSIYPVRNSFYTFLYRMEAAARLTYSLRMKGDYDIECAFLEFGPTKLLAGSTNQRAVRLAWVHTDLLKLISNPEEFANKYGGWYQHFHKVVCVSETVKRSFDQLYHNRYPSVVLYNYVDDETIKALSLAPLPFKRHKDKLVIVAAGTLHPPKNYPRLLRAFAQLSTEFDGLELWILGDGEQRGALERLAAELQIAGSIRFEGFRRNPYPYIRQADLLVCSSNYEGFSTVITEGLVLGKPIVTTECSGMRELLGDSEFGLITDNNDDAFSLGLRSLVTDSALRQRYAAKAAQRGQTISGQLQLEKIEQFFSSLVSERQEGV